MAAALAIAIGEEPDAVFKTLPSLQTVRGRMELAATRETGAKVFVEKFNYLMKFHEGKFHDAPSFKKAKFVDILQELLSLGIIITPISIKGKWCEIDTKHDLEIAKKMFK